MSRYENYLRGHGVRQEFYHPCARMTPPKAVMRKPKHLYHPGYESPDPARGHDSLRKLNEC